MKWVPSYVVIEKFEKIPSIFIKYPPYLLYCLKRVVIFLNGKILVISKKIYFGYENTEVLVWMAFH